MTLAAVGAIVAAAASASFPAAANAAEATAYARINDGVVAYSAAAGQQNSAYVVDYGADILIDDEVPIRVGAGCWHPDSADHSVVLCNDASGGVEVRLGDRNDLLYMEVSGADAAWGQGGHDEMEGTGWDTLYGGDGDDIMWTARYQYGGLGADWLIGSDLDSRLEGGGGHDSIYGEGGNDKLFGASGDDYLSGGAGRDLARGHDGEDLIYGDANDDKLYGGAHSDSIYGNGGNDLLHGDSGTDYLSGGRGTDNVYQN
jgi:Ca2+-binding RTX toxin-like protein